ncbi:MAG: hypothetical protein AB7G11_13715 [Phycisphaerales bacterium]
MSRTNLRCRRIGLFSGLLACAVAGLTISEASDHGDTPLLIGAGRHDARITDLFAFTRGENLVLILCANPAIPRTVTDYRFPSDVEFKIMLDNRSEVRFDDDAANALYGGTIVNPTHIRRTSQISIRFNPQGTPLVSGQSIHGGLHDAQVFTGLRDDPFIRGPRIGRNVAAIVVELPLSSVTEDGDTLLIWGTSTVRGLKGPIHDHVGRSLRSMFGENDLMNRLTPAEQAKVFAVPDVMILDTSRPTQYPNGRLLTDDVVDLVGDPRPLADDAPFPSTNDVPFLDEFPYLAPPHQP